MPDSAQNTRGPILAVDLGGTKLLVAQVDDAGHVGRTSKRPTAVESGADAVVDEIVGGVRELAAEPTKVRGIGIGVAGQVDPASGVVRQAPNLEWKDFPLRSRLEDALHVPVRVLNDVQAAAYGEWLHGAGKGVQDFVAVFVGTGVGGGIVHGGRLVLGCGGSAGEVGHTTVALDGPPCRCGNHGCLEAFVGGWAIARSARQAVADAAPGEADALLRRVQGDADKLTAEDVADAAAQGDTLAIGIVRSVGAALGAGIASIANAYNPCLVVLGGGVIHGMPQLIGVVQQVAHERALPAAVENLRIVPAGLGIDAGVVGAAAWARRELASAGEGPPDASAAGHP
jgi:glucokinase